MTDKLTNMLLQLRETDENLAVKVDFILQMAHEFGNQQEQQMDEIVALYQKMNELFDGCDMLTVIGAAMQAILNGCQMTAQANARYTDVSDDEWFQCAVAAFGVLMNQTALLNDKQHVGARQ